MVVWHVKVLVLALLKPDLAELQTGCSLPVGFLMVGSIWRAGLTVARYSLAV